MPECGLIDNKVGKPYLFSPSLPTLAVVPLPYLPNTLPPKTEGEEKKDTILHSRRNPVKTG
eukprot:6181131-Prorocentrum_lima.AAC.1